MNKIPLMDVQRQYKVHKNGIDKRIKKVLESGNFIMSEEVKIFEKNLCDFHNVKNAITVGNGTDALVIALKSIGIKPGDEVIVPAMSFFATSEAVIQAGAKVVFADINKDDFTIDVIEVEKHINERTKAIIPVHLYGKLSNMDDLMSLANKHNIFVIEDACQAIGATINNVKAGAYGHLACISFFPTKNLGAYGDGGLILTNDDILATRARALRVHGSGKNGVESYSFFNENNDSLELNDEFMEYHDTKYNNSIIGFNSRLDEIQASILDYKLNYLNQCNQRII
jgi:dTDP-4-amino-4,6-dideoxygalactose transaminase